MHVSYQLYCSRKFGPIEATLAMLAEAGYREVEGYGGLYEDVNSLETALQDTGLAMTSAHIGLDMVEGDPSRVLGIAERLGIQKILVPHLAPDARPTDAAGWEAFATRLVKAGQPYRDAGLVFGWHNHDFELADLGGGRTPLDILAQTDGIELELDLGWVRVAGHDPLDWLTRYGPKITAAHVKDIAPDGQAQDEDGWADVGHGIMDWDALFPALREAGVDHVVVEHDNPSDDRRMATRSLETIKGYVK
ncbi:sugar phosphate isomerase/epimerase family protein [Pseudoroseicyclus aestuarii]|uniref:Sugar phosphate isomerase/epimerase n=1 Tax=Pseudoroseicyclus aestuarii TaxID=1795041 RepID=A0A318SXZ1_9RHOB|nr:sugar phosphate isomerase/epimerase [Pseudoroseicyclus aestuarii]